jgi:hypothetical protein
MIFTVVKENIFYEMVITFDENIIVLPSTDEF